jgi:DNA-binding MarR family transcriptional regulator
MAARVAVDAYVLDSLMPDLVGHDRQPSAFLVYLYLYRHSRGRIVRSCTASLQRMASDTGLSKSAVQHAIRTLKRRRLLQSRQVTPNSAPEYLVATPWVRAPRQAS